MGFHGQEKIQFLTVIGFYTEVLVFIFLIMFQLLIAGILFLLISVPTTLMFMFTYNLWKREKIHAELGALPWMVGFIVLANGRWVYLDFAVPDKEEIIITDEQVAAFEKNKMFQEAVQNIKIDEKDFQVPGEDDRYLPPKDKADRRLAKRYEKYRLVTSRQVFLWELLKIHLKRGSLRISRRKRDKNGNIVEEIQPPHKEFTKHEGKKIWKKIKSKMKKLASGEKLIERTIINNDGKEETIKHRATLGDRTHYLERQFRKYIGTQNESYIVNYRDYHDNRIQLGSVSQYYYDDLYNEDRKGQKLKLTILVMVAVVSSVMTLIFGLGGYNQSISLAGLIIVPLIFIFVAIFSSLGVIKKLMKILKHPLRVEFRNILPPNIEGAALCYLERSIKEEIADARIYRLNVFKFPWKMDEIMVVLPASYEESFDFDIGRIPFKGYTWEAQTTPMVFVEIYELFNGTKVFMARGCSYIYNKVATIFYDYNIHQNWLVKIYLYLIGTLRAKIEIMNSKYIQERMRTENWKGQALRSSQIASDDSRRIQQELMKRRAASHGEQQQQMEQVNPSILDNRKFVYLLLLLVIILFIIVLAMGMSL